MGLDGVKECDQLQSGGGADGDYTDGFGGEVKNTKRFHTSTMHSVQVIMCSYTGGTKDRIQSIKN